MDLISKINSAQRREAIDEDKRIHKRALDAEFAFVKRIGEDSLPPREVDKYQLIKLTNLIQALRGELEATLLEVSNILNKVNDNEFDEDVSQSNSTVKALKYLDTGKAILYWNNFIVLKKTINMSEKQIQELWDYIHQNLDPIFSDLFYKLDEINTFYSETYELYDIEALKKMKEYIDNKQFNSIPALGKISSNTIQRIREQRDAERIRNAENIAGELEGYRGELPAEGEELNFNPWEGMGKKKRKGRGKKKMDDDESQINLEVVDKKKDGLHLNKMKKAIKTLALPFDDADDSNYRK